MDGIRLYNLIQHWHRKELEVEQQKKKLHIIANNSIMERPRLSAERNRAFSMCPDVESESEDELSGDDSSPDEDRRVGFAPGDFPPDTLSPEVPQLTMGQVRQVLSSATGCPARDVQRVLINKRLKNGSIIKIALTDEFLSKFTLDPSCDQNSFLSINQVC